MPNVILVDEQGQEIGEADVLAAHTGEGQLHMAFSAYVFRKLMEEILIQQRSSEKMLWPLVWANTWCSHPRKGETVREAGERRGREEMGITCTLQEGPSFVYRAKDPHGKGIEHEFVRTLIGTGDDVIVKPNPAEVANYKWVNVDALIEDMKATPDKYAPWFHIGLQRILANR